MTTDGRSSTTGGARPPEQWWLADPSGADGLIPAQRRIVPRDEPPDTIAGWQANAIRARTWPRITRLDDRWRWLVMSVVPRFRRLEADSRLIDANLRRIVAEARDYASMPCVQPLSAAGGEAVESPMS